MSKLELACEIVFFNINWEPSAEDGGFALLNN